MLKNKSIKDRLVPIIADEARTFGMEGLFRQIGIYSPNGQQYTLQDREQVAYYKEDEKGQILQEGINELGAGASWLAAATSYSTNNLPMIPFYIYYSMSRLPAYRRSVLGGWRSAGSRLPDWRDFRS